MNMTINDNNNKNFLLTHKVYYHLEQYLRHDDRDNYKFQSLRILKIDSVKAIIPKTQKFTNVLVLSSEFLIMTLGTICFIVIIRLVAFFMKFKKDVWQTLNISQIIMGMPANQEPNNYAEKIVFGSVVITCIVYTGYCYSVILDISLRMEPEISTLEELADSSLTPLMSSVLFRHLNRSSLKHLKKLAEKYDPLLFYKEPLGSLCLEYLAKYRNVSCIVSDAEYNVNTFSAVDGKELNVKILPEAVEYYISVWYVNNDDRYKPYIADLKKTILKASEFGLLNKYSTSGIQHYNFSPPEIIGKEKIFIIICHVLGIGYSLSIIAFLFEIFAASFGDTLYMYSLSKRFRFGN